MKKFLLSALTVVAALTASAADRVVYHDGTLGNYIVYDWWNNTASFDAANPAGEGNVMSFKAADGGATASMGIFGSELGPLHSATLNFKWYCTTAGQKLSIRLTSIVEENYQISTTADNAGQWNTVSVPVAEAFPAVASQWNDNKADGEGYVFGIVLENGAAETVFYFNDIIYTGIDESWTAPDDSDKPVPTSVPVPTQPAANVVSLYSDAYPAATTFGIGNWGQSTKTSEVTIDGKKVMKVTGFNYLGWEFANHLDLSACNTMHVDFFAVTEGNFGFTPIGGGENAWRADHVTVGEWNSYDVLLINYPNVNFADVYQVKFDQGNSDQEGYIANVYFYKDENVKAPEYGGVWYGHAEGTCVRDSKEYFITIDYAFTANEDGTIGIEAAIDGDEGLDAGHQIHIINAGVGDEWVNFTKNGDVWTGKTTTLTFTPGEAVDEMEFYMPYPGGVFHPFVRDYIYGASNEKPVAAISPRLTARAENVTAFGAEIAYEVTLPAELADADVTVYYNEETAAGSPIVLSGLADNTEYSYTLRAVAAKDGESYESKPVVVAFRTLRDGAKATVWHAIVDGMINNAYLPGEDPETMRRNIPVSIETTVTYNANGTVTVDAVFHGDMVVGFVPKVTVTGGSYGFERQPMTQAGEGYTITTNTEYPIDQRIDWLYFAIAYAGGESVINVPGYTTGMENEAPSYGEAAALSLEISNPVMKVGGHSFVTAIVKDAAGHYLLDNKADISVSGAAFSLDGNLITATDRGVATVTASYGNITATSEIKCVTTANAIDLTTIEGVSFVASSGDANLAFDKNEGSQIEWNCAESEEHSITVNFGKAVYVQTIELVWEGASATHYTVTLASEDSGANRVASYANNVFTVENGAGGAGVTAREYLYPEDFSSVKASSITLNTTKAFNAGWGIKLKEMYVHGSENSGTVGIETCDTVDANAPVEYYNMQGMRVDAANASAGLYIRRQGNNVTKVVIK